MTSTPWAFGPALSRLAYRVALCALIVVGLLGVRAHREAEAELGAAHRALAHKDASLALIHLDRAARWYAPLSPHRGVALAGLATMAEEALQTGGRAEAMRRLRLARGAHQAAVRFYDDVPEVTARLDALTDTLAASNARTIPSRDLPSVPFAWLSLLGFAGLLLSALGYIRQGLDREGTEKATGRGYVWAGVGAGLVWLLGLWLA